MTGTRYAALAAILMSTLWGFVTAPAAAPPNTIPNCRTISSPGSYTVTRDLSSSTGTCLTIPASDVTLDLGGFSIKGNPSGNGTGIAAAANTTNIVIRNGTVRDFGGYGIFMLSSSRVKVEAVRLINNRVDGVITGDDAVIKDCIVIGNNNNGITIAGFRALVTGNMVDGNGVVGIYGLGGGTLIGNTVSKNGALDTNVTGGGISIGPNTTLIGNTVSSNITNGIGVADGSTLVNNTASSNGAIGIYVNCPSNLSTNTATGNPTNMFSTGTGCVLSNHLAP